MKDKRIEDLDRELRDKEADCREKEGEVLCLTSEISTWKSRYDEVLDEVQTLRAQMNHARPRLSELEPRVEQLSRERSDWLSQRDRLEAEVKKLREPSECLEELSTEFENMKDYELDVSQQASLDGGLDLAKKHAMWAGMSAIRRLSVPLYDRIRAMFQDLHRTEVDLVQLHQRHEDLMSKHEALLKDHEIVNDKLSASEERMFTETSELHRTIEHLEHEIGGLQRKCCVVDQVREVIRSAVQMTQEADDSPHSGTFISNQSPVLKSGSHRGSGRYTHGYDLDGQLDEVQLEDLAALSLPSSPAIESTSPARKATTGSSSRRTPHVRLAQVSMSMNHAHGATMHLFDVTNGVCEYRLTTQRILSFRI